VRWPLAAPVVGAVFPITA